MPEPEQLGHVVERGEAVLDREPVARGAHLQLGDRPPERRGPRIEIGQAGINGGSRGAGQDAPAGAGLLAQQVDLHVQVGGALRAVLGHVLDVGDDCEVFEQV